MAIRVQRESEWKIAQKTKKPRKVNMCQNDK